MQNNHNSSREEGTPAHKDSDEEDSDEEDLFGFVAFPKKKYTPSETSPTSISTTDQGTDIIASPCTNTPVKVTQDVEEGETTEISTVEKKVEKNVKKVEKRVKEALIPNSLKKPSELYWHTFFKKGRRMLEPCCECPHDEAPDIDHGWDPNKKVLIQYIECCWFTQRKLVSRSSLTPYHGKKPKNKKEREEEGDEGKEMTNIPKTWCGDKLILLEKARKKSNWPESEILQEGMFLQRILDSAIEAHDQTRKREDEKEKDAKILLQGSLSDKSRQPDKVNATDNNSAISDEDDSELVTKEKSKTELLRCGDVIEYYNPIFVFGDDQGLKSATIIAVDPKANPVLALCSGDVLPVDTKVKRIKIIYRGKLLDNEEKGTFNTIEWYKLRKDVKKSKDYDSNIMRNSIQYRDIVDRRQERFKRKIKESGFGDCTEIMTRYKRKRKS